MRAMHSKRMSEMQMADMLRYTQSHIPVTASLYVDLDGRSEDAEQIDFAIYTGPEFISVSLQYFQLEEFAMQKCLSALTKLCLAHNRLKEVPAGLPPTLTDLDLSYNDIEELPEGLHLPNLVSLDVSHCHLEALPLHAAHMPVLERLYACHNHIEELSADFSFPILRAVDLSFNELDELPHSFGMASLEAVNLERNYFTRLPASVWNLSEFVLDSEALAENPLQFRLPVTVRHRRLLRIEEFLAELDAAEPEVWPQRCCIVGDPDRRFLDALQRHPMEAVDLVHGSVWPVFAGAVETSYVVVQRTDEEGNWPSRAQYKCAEVNVRTPGFRPELLALVIVANPERGDDEAQIREQLRGLDHFSNEIFVMPWDSVERVAELLSMNIDKRITVPAGTLDAYHSDDLALDSYLMRAERSLLSVATVQMCYDVLQRECVDRTMSEGQLTDLLVSNTELDLPLAQRVVSALLLSDLIMEIPIPGARAGFLPWTHPDDSIIASFPRCAENLHRVYDGHDSCPHLLQFVVAQLVWLPWIDVEVGSRDAVVVVMSSTKRALMYTDGARETRLDIVTKHGELMTAITQTVEVILNGGSVTPSAHQVERLCGCSACGSGMISLEAIVEKIFGSTSETEPEIGCPSCSALCSVEALCPDLYFTELKHFRLDELDFVKKLANGAWGEVWLAKQTDGTKVAVKRLVSEITTTATMQMVQFTQEVYMNAQVSLGNINIINMLGLTLNPLQLVFELATNPDLFDVLNNPTLYDELSTRWRLNVAKDIARAMKFLHGLSPPVIHRDLRSPNVFVVSLDANDGLVVKIGDLGLAVYDTIGLDQKLSAFRWLAPEVLAGNRYDHRSDAYSFGIICWELAARGKPFPQFDPGKTSIGTRAIITQGIRPEAPAGSHPLFKRIMDSTLHHNPSKRAPFIKVLSWLEEELGV